MPGLVRDFTELDVYRNAMSIAMELFELSKSFPKEEKYSLVDQMRRSSRSVCANLAEAWRKRRYCAAFIAKLSDSEAEAAETQVWVDFSVKCGYLRQEQGTELLNRLGLILSQLSIMAQNATRWLLP